MESLKSERDHALSLLVEADAKIVDLLQDNAELRAKIPNSNVTPIGGRTPVRRTPSAVQDVAEDPEFEDIK
jgi:hypothetical protein